jgi:hypothetical protein
VNIIQKVTGVFSAGVADAWEGASARNSAADRCPR